MSDHLVSFITAPAEVAENIARTLVEEELAMCVNISAQVISIYRWEGQVETSHESLLIVKSMSDKIDALIARVREIHPYEVPEVVSCDITKGNPEYLDWLAGKEVAIEEEPELDEEETAG